MILSVAAALAVGVGVGAAVANAAGSPHDATASSIGDASPAKGAEPVVTQQVKHNAAGLTYGAAGQGASPADDPDLVLIVATNGKTGYAYTRDLNGPTPTSPSEALDLTNNRTVPVYLSDGTTKIGEFVFG